MIVKSFSITLKKTYAPYDKYTNPYVAKLSVEHNDVNMEIVLAPETALKVLDICSSEVAQAAANQMAIFTAQVSGMDTVNLIEGTTDE